MKLKNFICDMKSEGLSDEEIQDLLQDKKGLKMMTYCTNCNKETALRTYEEYKILNPNSEFTRQEYYGACSVCGEPEDRFGIGLREVDEERSK